MRRGEEARHRARMDGAIRLHAMDHNVVECLYGGKGSIVERDCGCCELPIDLDPKVVPFPVDKKMDIGRGWRRFAARQRRE
jgi:hypothetical protein